MFEIIFITNLSSVDFAILSKVCTFCWYPHFQGYVEAERIIYDNKQFVVVFGLMNSQNEKMFLHLFFK